MLHYLRQNKHIIAASLTLFVISLSTLMFFVSANHEVSPADYHATVIEHKDSSTHKQEDLSAHELEEQYRTFVHNEQDSLIILNPKAEIEFVTWDFEILMGHAFKDIEHHAFSTLLHPEDQELFLNGFDKARQTQQTVNLIGPYRLRDEEAQYHLHMGTAIPVFENGKMTKVIFIDHDIHESLDKKNPSSKDVPKGENAEDYSGEKIRNKSNRDDARLMAETIIK